MSDLNKAFILGRLGMDPEMSYTPAGDPVARFSVATSKKWKSKSGEMAESTEWHNCVAWNKLAEIAAQYLKKGSQIHIEGELKTSTWEKDGIKRYKTEIIVKEFIMLGGKPGGNTGDGGGAKQGDGSSGEGRSENGQKDSGYDGCPF